MAAVSQTHPLEMQSSLIIIKAPWESDPEGPLSSLAIEANNRVTKTD